MFFSISFSLKTAQFVFTALSCLISAQVWLSAQRLKHGVSWTPEEVEEARRKQFNGTVHTVPQTITVIPAHQLSAAANGLQSILQTCQIVGQPGLMFTQVRQLTYLFYSFGGGSLTPSLLALDLSCI